MRIFIGTLLMTAALTVHGASAAATIPDYQPRPAKTASGSNADPRNANETMPSSSTRNMPNKFYAIPARR